MNREFWGNKKVLVTGHEGFLGSCLVKKLIECRAEVIGVDKVINRPVSMLNGLRHKIIVVKGDVSDSDFIKRFVNEYKPEIIFHLAAEAIVEECHKNPIRAFKSNIEGTWNILEGTKNKKFVKSIVVASSDKAYGSHEILPYKEDAPLQGNHPYDVSKSCTDLICNTYFNTYGVPVSVTRCGNIFGPGDFNYSRIVPDAIRCALNCKTFIMRSDGSYTRDYVYIDDIISGYLLVAENIYKKNIAGMAFNFSYEKPISVMDIVKKIYKITGNKINYKVENRARYEIKHQYLSSSRARRILNWKPRYDLNKGLEKTIEWYSDLFKAM